MEIWPDGDMEYGDVEYFNMFSNVVLWYMVVCHTVEVLQRHGVLFKSREIL